MVEVGLAVELRSQMQLDLKGGVDLQAAGLRIQVQLG